MKIQVYFQTVTPESAERGDFAETGGHETHDVESVEDIVDILQNAGYLEPSCDGTGLDVWFTSEPEQDYQDGSDTSYTYHADGIPEFMWRRALSILKGRAA